MTLARIGSGCYVVWGLLHFIAAYDEFTLGSGLDRGLVQGKIFQGGWDLLFFAVFALVIAVRYNWRNDALGYWLNLVVVSAADIGFVVFILIPGHVAFFPGVLGPVFWLLGALFTTLGLRARPA